MIIRYQLNYGNLKVSTFNRDIIHQRVKTYVVSTPNDKIEWIRKVYYNYCLYWSLPGTDANPGKQPSTGNTKYL